MEKLVKGFRLSRQKGSMGRGMGSILSKKAGFWVLVLLSTLSISTGVMAQDTAYVKQGLYVGVIVPYNTIGGDFDGNTLLATATEIIIIPKIDGNVGFGAVLGARFKMAALEVSYLRSEHDATWSGAAGTAAYNIVDLDFKIYPSINSQMQPYVLFGLGIPWLTIHDGAATATEVGDATLLGWGLNIGGGLAYYFQPQISVHGGVVYRWTEYSDAKGVSGISRTIQGGLDGSGLALKFGITYTF